MALDEAEGKFAEGENHQCLAEKQHLKASDGKTQLVLKTHLGRMFS